MDREAAALMGVEVMKTNAMTFGIGAFMAGAAGCLLSIIYRSRRSTRLCSSAKLRRLRTRRAWQRARAIVGGVALGLIESLSALWFGPEYAVTVSFTLLIVFLAVRPTGLIGKRGYE